MPAMFFLSLFLSPTVTALLIYFIVQHRRRKVMSFHRKYELTETTESYGVRTIGRSIIYDDPPLEGANAMHPNAIFQIAKGTLHGHDYEVMTEGNRWKRSRYYQLLATHIPLSGPFFISSKRQLGALPLGLDHLLASAVHTGRILAAWVENGVILMRFPYEDRLDSVLEVLGDVYRITDASASTAASEKWPLPAQKQSLPLQQI